ncbi:uncharacterized protein BDW70DRAFT_74626 [Aspergillus foveolatus]|uniref:uncharacterized protein n=1 Tax=Aspergillus foveolatus TaxID=210207 RepID=UPI003CCD8A0A
MACLRTLVAWRRDRLEWQLVETEGEKSRRILYVVLLPVRWKLPSHIVQSFFESVCFIFGLFLSLLAQSHLRERLQGLLILWS